MLIGPFRQIVTMTGLPASGPIADQQLQIVAEGGIRLEGAYIKEVGHFNAMRQPNEVVHCLSHDAVALPGFIDAHTHICYVGTRVADYAARLNGSTYQQIAANGGGIHHTVQQTRQASVEDLQQRLLNRCHTLLGHGVTTCEVKSGYGLTVKDEIKQLECIQAVSQNHPIDLVATCLAAHTKPLEFATARDYLEMLISELFPQLIQKKLTQRIDIFVDQHAFSFEDARYYLTEALAQGFKIVLHADQFSPGGALLAAELNALSADHLECTRKEDAIAMLQQQVIPIVLPGATLGLGMTFPPARLLLDVGLPLVIASDWNPGSAPMGDLLTQTALLSAAQQLTMAESLAAITERAAKALSLSDRGKIEANYLADLVLFNCSDFREILYYQGALKPQSIFKRGQQYTKDFYG